jgi:acyl-CoA dehydrogenase
MSPSRSATTPGYPAEAGAGVDPFADSERIVALRRDIRALCMRFPDAYWRDLDRRREYPEDFVQVLTEAGWLAALIPTAYGGRGFGLQETAAILQEINQSGGYAGPAHAQIYVMGALLRHGSEEQKERYLPQIASGALRLQAFAVTEPKAGTDTTRIETRAVRDGDRYVIDGRKIFISRMRHSDLMVLLARTAPRDEHRPTAGLSLFLVDLREAGDHIRLRPLRMMMNNDTSEVTFDGLPVPAANLIGVEGQAFAISSTGGTLSVFSSRPSASGMGVGLWSARPGTPGSARSSGDPSAPTRVSSSPWPPPGPSSRRQTW